MMTWCLEHPWMTLVLAWSTITGVTHVLHHVCHIFIRHPFYGHEEKP